VPRLFTYLSAFLCRIMFIKHIGRHFMATPVFVLSKGPPDDIFRAAPEPSPPKDEHPPAHGGEIRSSNRWQAVLTPDQKLLLLTIAEVDETISQRITKKVNEEGL
jgi:hypothetical protein